MSEFGKAGQIGSAAGQHQPCGDQAGVIALRELQHYQPEQLTGKQVVIVANLEPRQMRGEVSQGMMLAASDPATGRVIVLTPSEAVAAGSKVS